MLGVHGVICIQELKKPTASIHQRNTGRVYEVEETAIPMEKKLAQADSFGVIPNISPPSSPAQHQVLTHLSSKNSHELNPSLSEECMFKQSKQLKVNAKPGEDVTVSVSAQIQWQQIHNA